MGNDHGFQRRDRFFDIASIDMSISGYIASIRLSGDLTVKIFSEE
jgi:hypothetical protein